MKSREPARVMPLVSAAEVNERLPDAKRADGFPPALP
jgi:hypothetical protein